MDIKIQASMWNNVQGELSAALVAFASDLGRVFGCNDIAHIEDGAAAQNLPVVDRMRELFEYGIHGRWNSNWEPMDPDDDDAIFFVQDLQSFRLVALNAGNVEMPLSRYVVGCAIARAVHDHGIRLVFPPIGQSFVGYCASDLAYLSGLDERTVRNLMGKKGTLRSVNIDKRAFVAYDDGAAWLASRGFKETVFISEEARNLARHPFSGNGDIAKYLNALMAQKKVDEKHAPVDVRELLAAAQSDSIKFDLRKAIGIAQYLGAEPKLFALSLAQHASDKQRQEIEQAFPDGGAQQ